MNYDFQFDAVFQAWPLLYIVVAAIYLALALAFSALFRAIYQLALNYPDRR